MASSGLPSRGSSSSSSSSTTTTTTRGGASDVRPAAPYTTRAPSPPNIVIPTPILRDANAPMKVVPSYDNVDPSTLSTADLEIITQNCKEQIAHDSASNWSYESRRTAQPILDFLYLGPSSVARDRQWLRDHGITMLLAARDSQMAEARLMGVDRVARDLGIDAVHVDVNGPAALIRAFPSAIAAINQHLLRVYREQAVQGDRAADFMTAAATARDDPGAMVIDHHNFRRGRVLVFCETGNDRSASIIVAYLMAVLGQDMISACQWVCFKRFCVCIDEQHKHLLQTFEGLLNAQRAVHRHEMTAPSALAPASQPTKKSKRHIEDTFTGGAPGDQEAFDDPMADEFALDRDRYVGRAPFVPFVDHGGGPRDAQHIGA